MHGVAATSNPMRAVTPPKFYSQARSDREPLAAAKDAHISAIAHHDATARIVPAPSSARKHVSNGVIRLGSWQQVAWTEDAEPRTAGLHITMETE